MLNVKRLAIIGLLLLIIGLTGALFTYQSIADSEPVKQERIFNETITDIIVESDNSKIEILPALDQNVKVEFTVDSTNKSRYNLEAEVEDGKLQIKVKEKILQFFNFDFNWKSFETKIYLPENTYDTIMAKTENGQVKIGNISVTSLEGVSTNGRITLENLDAQEIMTNTENGKIKITDVDGELRAKATNGRIELEAESIDRPIDFETVNGKITIQVDERPENAVIDVEIVNGSINIFGEKSHHTTIGNGENQIKLKTVNGSIKVEN